MACDLSSSHFRSEVHLAMRSTCQVSPVLWSRYSVVIGGYWFFHSLLKRCSLFHCVMLGLSSLSLQIHCSEISNAGFSSTTTFGRKFLCGQTLRPYDIKTGLLSSIRSNHSFKSPMELFLYNSHFIEFSPVILHWSNSSARVKPVCDGICVYGKTNHITDFALF